MKKIEIWLMGEDDTSFEIEVTEKEYRLLLAIEEGLNNNDSMYAPIISVIDRSLTKEEF